MIANHTFKYTEAIPGTIQALTLFKQRKWPWQCKPNSPLPMLSKNNFNGTFHFLYLLSFFLCLAKPVPHLILTSLSPPICFV